MSSCLLTYIRGHLAFPCEVGFYIWHDTEIKNNFKSCNGLKKKGKASLIISHHSYTRQYKVLYRGV